MYGAVPPDTPRSIAPVLAPKQLTLVWLLLKVRADAGWVIVIDAVAVQLFESVTVTV